MSITRFLHFNITRLKENYYQLSENLKNYG